MKNTMLFLMLLCSTLSINAQDYKVSGTVRDQNKAVIPGVTILIKGSSIGTATDFDGKFTLKIPEGSSTLLFSGVGLEGKQLVVNSASSKLNVVLKYSLTQLKGVQLVSDSKQTRIEKKGFSVDAIENSQN